MRKIICRCCFKCGNKSNGSFVMNGDHQRNICVICVVCCGKGSSDISRSGVLSKVCVFWNICHAAIVPQDSEPTSNTNTTEIIIL